MFITFTRAANMQRVCIHRDLIGRVEEESGMLGSVHYGCRIYARHGRANWKAVERYLDILAQIKSTQRPEPDLRTVQNLPAAPCSSPQPAAQSESIVP